MKLRKLFEKDEPFIENPEWRINNILKKNAIKISKWIKENKLPFNIKKEAIIKNKDFSGTSNGFYYHFTIDKYYYILYFMIQVEWAMEEKIKSCYIRIDKYNSKYIKIADTYSENLTIKEFTEEKFVDMIKKLNEEI